MLISLSSLGDLSRFVGQRSRFHETVLLLVDGASVTCSGTILSARSALLEGEVAKHYEIALDSGFIGRMDGVLQCLQLLYGGEVFLDCNNIIAILRFSVQFEIKELVMRCVMWLEENNLYPEGGLFKDSSIRKKLQQVDKLVPRIETKQSAALDSTSSSSSSESERDSLVAVTREPLPDPTYKAQDPITFKSKLRCLDTDHAIVDRPNRTPLSWGRQELPDARVATSKAQKPIIIQSKLRSLDKDVIAERAPRTQRPWNSRERHWSTEEPSEHYGHDDRAEAEPRLRDWFDNRPKTPARFPTMKRPEYNKLPPLPVFGIDKLNLVHVGSKDSDYKSPKMALKPRPSCFAASLASVQEFPVLG